MELSELHLILDQLEPGMSITVPKDWISLYVEGADETQRDLNTIEFVLERGCTWERDPQAKDLTFRKQPSAALSRSIREAEMFEDVFRHGL